MRTPPAIVEKLIDRANGLLEDGRPQVGASPEYARALVELIYDSTHLSRSQVADRLSLDLDDLYRANNRARNKKAMRALESLTPGGSEYIGDPEACRDHIRRALDSGIKAKKDRVRLLRAARHVQKVFRSMADRGRYPLELIPESEHFLGEQGWRFLSEAIEKAEGK